MNDAMDAKLTELLLKTRKGATAGFETKQWKTVLETFGFSMVLTKERNTVVKATVTAANGSVFENAKRPGYRCITWYDLGRWLKSVGFDMVAEASKLLGLDTPDVEKKLKDLYVRDLTNTGTCPVCEGNFKRNDVGGMVHHGYQRPGDGYIHGDCFGVGYQCWELEATGAQEYVELALKPHLAGLQSYLTQLKAGEIKTFHDTDHKWEPSQFGQKQVKVVVAVTRESDEYRFERLLASAIHTTERKIDWTTSDIARFEKRIAGWKLDVLPEVKYAGKFKAAGGGQIQAA